MKFNKWTIGLAAIAVMAIQNVSGQTNVDSVPNQLPKEQFYNTALDWLTHIDRSGDKQWTNIDLEISTGYKQVTGVGAASDLTVQYDINRFNVGAAIQFSGVGSPINTFEAQGGYAVIQNFDVKLETDLRIGYDDTKINNIKARGFEVEPAVFLTKLMTSNTYSRIGISLPIYFQGGFNSTPSFYVEVGFGHLK